MLKDRIIATCRFFDLQDLPLSLLELHTYLLGDISDLRRHLNDQWELETTADETAEPVSLAQVLACLDSECREAIQEHEGYYFLRGRQAIVERRLHNYFFGIVREKYIKRFIPFLRFVPFVRGVGLAGSQSLGQQKSGSDIDLLIITDPRYLWLTRTLVTGYFQFIGKRRQGNYVANRFCLNHYVASPKEVQDYKNLYTASEYGKLRPLVFANMVRRFQYNNRAWIQQVFPNVQFAKLPPDKPNRFQQFLERIVTNNFGDFLERQCKNMQLPKIRREEKFIVVTEDELSFHPHSKQQGLLEKFFNGSVDEF